MGCCCSSAPVVNDMSDPNSPNSGNQTANFPNQNDTNNTIPDSGNIVNLDSTKINKDDTQNILNKDKNSLLTISENNQINEYDVSYDEDYNLEGYTFEKEIGYGGSAEVVQMSKEGVSYAVKIIDLNNSKTNYLESDHKPKEEVAILKQFNHIHVVKFIEFIEDQDNNKLYIVMELLSGGTIMECKTFEEKREAFTEALSAVQYIHFQRIAHQDIKPANILRNENGTIKLVDFGSAVFVEEGKTKIPVGITGTIMFSPPEKFTSTLYDPFAGDVWSLGVTLYNMLFGKLPFEGQNVFQVQNLIKTAEPNYPEDDEYKDAVDLIKQMLKKNPIDRIKVEQICDHPFILQTSTSSLRSFFDSSSRIFESLKSTDTMNSMTRISRGSFRSSLKGNTVKIKASKTSVKKIPQKPKRHNQKPQSQLITGPKDKFMLEKQKQAQKHNQKQKETKKDQENDQQTKTENKNNEIDKKQEQDVEKKDQYYVVDIDSEPSFQDSSDDNSKIPKKVQNQQPENPTKSKRNTSTKPNTPSKSRKEDKNNQEKNQDVPQKQKENIKKNDMKPGSSRKQSRENVPANEMKPSNSRKSKQSTNLEQAIENSIRRVIDNKSKSQKDINAQEQKQDSPRKPKDNAINPAQKPNSSRQQKQRRQSKQFIPKKD